MALESRTNYILGANEKSEYNLAVELLILSQEGIQRANAPCNFVYEAE